MNLQAERLIFSFPREQDAYDVYSHKREKESTIFTGGIPINISAIAGSNIARYWEGRRSYTGIPLNIGAKDTPLKRPGQGMVNKYGISRK